MKNEKAIERFGQVLAATDQLLTDCLWHKEQTFETIRGLLLEEAYEIIDAIDQKDIPNLIEELGDLFYNVILLTKLGEKGGQFTSEEPLNSVYKKLISRHPHVFGSAKGETIEQIMEKWEQVKKEEKKERKSALDGIAQKLPTLARAFKVAQRTKATHKQPFKNEEELEAALWELVVRAKEKDLNPEIALRKKLEQMEKTFREKERGTI